MGDDTDEEDDPRSRKKKKGGSSGSPALGPAAEALDGAPQPKPEDALTSHPVGAALPAAYAPGALINLSTQTLSQPNTFDEEHHESGAQCQPNTASPETQHPGVLRGLAAVLSCKLQS